MTIIEVVKLRRHIDVDMPHLSVIQIVQPLGATLFLKYACRNTKAQAKEQSTVNEFKPATKCCHFAR